MARQFNRSVGGSTPGTDSAASRSYDLVMDEARQRWRSDNWRAKPEDFAITRDELVADMPKAAQLDPDRLKLDVKRDLMGESLSLKSLQSLDYSASYRPRGQLDERISEPYSNPRKYEILAGVTQAPPEDLSFLADAEKRRARMGERSGALRRTSQRLETSVDERRRKINSILPDDAPKTVEIITESKKRRAREDKEIGRKVQKKEKKIRFSSEVTYDEYLENYYAEHAERLEALPKQAGMAKSTQKLPQFYSETRNWSNIKSADPSWSEIMRNTHIVMPEEESEQQEDSRARYVSDDAFDPAKRYRPLQGIAPRDVRSGSLRQGQLDEEVIERSGVSPERVHELMTKKYRGRWLPPEFFYDDELVAEYYNLSGRGAVSGEDFISWAQRQRAQIERREMDVERMEHERMRRMRAASPGRRHSPYVVPGSRRMNQEDIRRMYERAHEEGYNRAQEYLRAEKAEEDRRRAEEKRRAEQEKRAKKEKLRKDQERSRAEYENYMKQAQKAQEEYQKQAQKARRDYEKQAKNAGQNGSYTGMYPDLFERYGQYDPYNQFSDGSGKGNRSKTQSSAKQKPTQ